jgi:ABC-type transport system involved in cytochrome c biogenesis permease component
MAEPDRLNELRAMLGERQRGTFAPGFADRTVARWRAELAARGLDGSVALRRALAHWFARLVPVAAAAAVLLAAYNVRHRATGQTALAAMIGVTATQPSAHASPSMRSLDELYGLGSLGDSTQE